MSRIAISRKNFLIILALLIIISVSGCKHPSQSLTGREQVVLTLAAFGDKTYPSVLEFNASQSSYKIEVKDYSDGNTIDIDTARNRLYADLSAGDGPDMIDLYSFHVDSQALGQRGVVENLYPYIDTDAELNRSDIVDSVLTAFDVDGSLYTTVGGFGIITILAKESVAAQYEEWTMDALIQLAEQYGGGDQLFSTNYNSFDFLDAALSLSSEDYIDFNSNQVCFDGAAYEKLLSFCKTFGNGESNERPPLAYYCITTFLELQYYEQLFGELAVDVGFPTENGHGSCFANMVDQFSMSTTSKNKDGVWKFLRIYFTEDYQLSNYVNSSFRLFPSNKNALNEMVQADMQTLYTTDEQGIRVENTHRGAQEDFQYHAATQAQVDQMMEIIRNTTQVYHDVSLIRDLALTEAAAYFNGDKSLEDTTAATQRVISTYWSEQME